MKEIQSTKTNNLEEGNVCLLKIMFPPKLHNSFKVTDVHGCYHISCVKPNYAWVSDESNCILINVKGDTLHRVKNLCNGLKMRGVHTVNKQSELIYIDTNYKIRKLSMDRGKTTTLIERTDYTWTPQCVYSCQSSGDLLVGYFREGTKAGKVTRYNQNRQLTQTIQRGSNDLELYKGVHFIAENNNGDVIVSDVYGAVVVTERGGRNRFTYTGHPPGSGLSPLGICTDALSHILVYDICTTSVHMLDSNGQFLRHLLTKSKKIGKLQCMSYDYIANRLWVGSKNNNKVCVYGYIWPEDTVKRKSGKIYF